VAAHRLLCQGPWRVCHVRVFGACVGTRVWCVRSVRAFGEFSTAAPATQHSAAPTPGGATAIHRRPRAAVPTEPCTSP
jgi:hypothetical protein